MLILGNIKNEERIYTCLIPGVSHLEDKTGETLGEGQRLRSNGGSPLVENITYYLNLNIELFL